MLALDYCLKKVYSTAESDLQGYHVHVKAMESAFDWHQDQLKLVMERAQSIVVHQEPFYWKHVDVVHAMVLEDVPAGMPLLTHKPICVLEGSLTEETAMFYLQAFYVTMIQWPSERTAWFSSLYHSGMIRECESLDAYATAAALCITWADQFLEHPERTEDDWHIRCVAFFLFMAKCVPCPHTCGRLMIMGPEYFEQVDDVHVPNALMTPYMWSAPFGVFGYKYDECKGHELTQVTYADKPLKAGDFIRVPLRNPFLIEDHASHMNQTKAARLCHSIYSLGATGLTHDDALEKLQQLQVVMNEHVRMAEEPHSRWAQPPAYLWPSRLSSIAFASATTFCCVLQQCNHDDRRVAAAMTCMTRMIKHFSLPWLGWYTSMLLDLKAPCYQHAIFDPWRAALAAYEERARLIQAVAYK